MKVILLLALFPLTSFAGGKCELNFDQLKAGTGLTGWLSGFYGDSGSPVWKVERDSSAPSKPMVLKQSGHAPYSWYVKKEPVFANGTVEADFQIASGNDDPEAGLIWRQFNSQNYLYVRANAAKDNLVLYRMRDGKKEVIKEAETKIPYRSWHKLKASFHGEQLEISLDGKTLISVSDNSNLKAGRVGFFTTADTVAVFDNFNCSQK